MAYTWRPTELRDPLGTALGKFDEGLAWGRNEKFEKDAPDTFAAYLDSLSGGTQQPVPGSGVTTNAQVTGSHDAAAAAQDPLLTAFFANTRRSESGGNDSAKNPNSSATGRYQFLEGTWADLANRHPELGLTPDGRTDPAQQEAAMKVFTQENAGHLGNAGVPVNPGSLYAAHFLGAGGASKVLAGDPNSPVSAYVDPAVIQANPQLANMTVGQFAQWANEKGGGSAGGYQPPMAAQPGQQPQGQGGAPGLPPREVMLDLFKNPNTRPIAIELAKANMEGRSAKPVVINDRLVNPYTGAVIGDYSDTANGGNGDLGLNPQYGVDAEGNPVILQLGKNGKAIQTAMPDGVKLSKEPIKIDAGTHWVLLDPITRQPVGQVEKNNEEAAFQSGFGTAAGKAAAERIDALPGALAKADNMMSTIDGILNDPALDVSTGWLSWMQQVPGTDQYRFGQRALQLQGQSFLQAFESLKGGGQITEVEGAKATQAIGRLSTAQSAKDYRDALDELKGIITAAKQRTQAAAGGQGGASSGYTVLGVE